LRYVSHSISLLMLIFITTIAHHLIFSSPLTYPLGHVSRRSVPLKELYKPPFDLLPPFLLHHTPFNVFLQIEPYIQNGSVLRLCAFPNYMGEHAMDVVCLFSALPESKGYGDESMKFVPAGGFVCRCRKNSKRATRLE
jgi:hypothetical protein